MVNFPSTIVENFSFKVLNTITTAKKQNIKDNSPGKLFLKKLYLFMEKIINKQSIPKLQAFTTS